MIALISIYRAISRYIDYRDRPRRHLGFCDNVRSGTRHSPRPVWKSFSRARRVAGSLHGCSILLCWGRFVLFGQLVLRSLQFHAEHKYKQKNLWNPSWKVLRPLNFCNCFTIVLFSLGIQQAIYFSLILSRCNSLFSSKCHDIVYYNCKLKL